MAKEIFYTSYENQIRPDGSQGVLWAHFTRQEGETEEQLYNRALAKLYTILQAAAVSECVYHAGHLYRSDGILVDGRVFDRREPPQATVEEG